jgi:hypothetical protein
MFTWTMTEFISKCISISCVIFKLPMQSAQAVPRSPFRVSTWTLIILKPCSWYFPAPPRKLLYIYSDCANSLFTRHPVRPVYFTSPSVCQFIRRRWQDGVVNNYFQKIWKQAIVVQSRYNLCICLKALRTPQISSVWLVGVPADVRRDVLHNTSLLFSRYTSLLGFI